MSFEHATRRLLLLTGFAAVLLAASSRATLERDSTPVYTGPAASGPVVMTLKRGDAVTVGMSLSGSDGDWCNVTPDAAKNRSGFVPCAALKRGGATAPAIETASEQEPASPIDEAHRISLLMREGRGLTATQAAALEQTLTRKPADMASRAKLLGFYFYSGPRYLGAAAAIQARRRHILWLIDAKPESALLGTSETTIDRAGHGLADPQGYDEARTAWIAQTGRKDVTAKILGNAAHFFRLPDKGLAIEMLKRARALEPGNPEWAGELGEVYAMAVLGITGMNQNGLPSAADPAEASSPLARVVRSELRRSQDAPVLIAAGSILTLKGSILHAARKGPGDYNALAEELLLRARELAPNDPAATAALGALHDVRAMEARSR